MEVVTSRSYKLNVRPYWIEPEDVRRALKYPREHHQAYYTICRVMLESGARFEHVLKMIAEWNPDETVEVPGTRILSRKLVCFKDKSFCRYYMGLRETEKPCEWVYFSTETLKLVESIAGKHITRHQVRRYTKHHNLVLPKYMRKISWRLMIKVMSGEIARFVQSRFRELRVSEARHETSWERQTRVTPSISSTYLVLYMLVYKLNHQVNDVMEYPGNSVFLGILLCLNTPEILREQRIRG